MFRTARIALAAGIAVAILAPAAPASSPDSRATRVCRAPSVDAGFVRRLRHDARTSCGEARSAASEWVARYLDGSSTRRFRGWRCEGRSRVTCARGARVIRFSFGA